MVIKLLFMFELKDELLIEWVIFNGLNVIELPLICHESIWLFRWIKVLLIQLTVQYLLSGIK